MIRFTFIIALFMAFPSYAAAANADPKYSEVLGADATVEDCARTIVTKLIAAGEFRDISAREFMCSREFFQARFTNCTFQARDTATKANAFHGNIEVKMVDRWLEDPRTGAETRVKYCRIAPRCWISGPPFRLYNVNGTMIQRNWACVLDTDRLGEW